MDRGQRATRGGGALRGRRGHGVREHAILAIVELSPITGVIHVTESDYARFHEGQTATLATDAYPGETFNGQVARIAPIFQQTSRQAQELAIDNPDQRLKPGMFIRVTLELARAEDATIIPEAAIATRGDVALRFPGGRRGHESDLAAYHHGCGKAGVCRWRTRGSPDARLPWASS